uniref:Undecaprenyl pyrophosphate synthase n=1 Tax=uncultured marine group II/III euryarchaeote KM3_139_C07 TaxID=1457870 RepID=A0A075G9S4_9EURY|nr:undecaprenyl pyrophosphate synthase [uncultured marine group II/III euryarchaeote KM3_139_C07]
MLYILLGGIVLYIDMFGIKKKKDNSPLKSKSIRHIALSLNGIDNWSKDHNQELGGAWKESFLAVKEIMALQVKMDVPIFTFNVLPMEIKGKDTFSLVVDSLVEFFNHLLSWDFIKENQVKISVLGKWYDMPGRLVEVIKKLTVETKDYDKFFVNFCVNYDGQEEMIDSFRIIARKIKSATLDPDSITKEEIKDNIYSSYFMPPDIIIITGGKKSLGGFLLWDSINSRAYFFDKLWPDFKGDDLTSIIQNVFNKK